MMIGICGDNCTYCPRYIATQSGEKTELEKVKELWVRLGLRDHDYPVQDMACHGCLPGNTCAYKELRSCISEKGHENCGFCDDYPCKIINTVFDKSDKLKARAKKVCTEEEMGILQSAFFSKKDYFDDMHQRHQQNISTSRHE